MNPPFNILTFRTLQKLKRTKLNKNLKVKIENFTKNLKIFTVRKRVNSSKYAS